MNIFEKIGHKVAGAVSRVGHKVSDTVSGIGNKIKSGVSSVAGRVGDIAGTVNQYVGGNVGKVAGYVSDYGKYAVPIAGLINPLAGLALGGLVAGAGAVSGADTISRGAMRVANRLR